jgi:hypothetical protein
MTDVWKVARAVDKLADGEIVFSGDIATLLHVQRRPKADLPLEVMHDVGASISAVATVLLRDLAVFGAGRWQIRVENVDVDLYPPHVSQLRFPYLDLVPHAQRYRGLSIASIPHLLLLKVDAIEDRGHSGKGAKDRRDAAKLLVLLHGSPQVQKLLAGLASPDDLAILRGVVKSAAFMEIARGNAKQASVLRKRAAAALDAVDAVEDVS